VEVFDAPRGLADGLRKQLREHAYVIVGDSSPRLFDDGAELGRVREARPPYSWRPEVHVHPYITLDIAFHEGAPAYGGPVQDVLRRIRDEVVAALEALEPFV